MLVVVNGKSKAGQGRERWAHVKRALVGGRGRHDRRRALPPASKLNRASLRHHDAESGPKFVIETPALFEELMTEAKSTFAGHRTRPGKFQCSDHYHASPST